MCAAGVAAFDSGLSDVPATLIVTAECDPLRDDGEQYAKRLRRAGAAVELRRYRGMIHGFFQTTGALEGSRRLHRELADWMREAADQAKRVTGGDEVADASRSGGVPRKRAGLAGAQPPSR